MISNIW